VGPEHLLLSLLPEGGVAAGVLESFGADPTNIRTEVTIYVPPGHWSSFWIYKNIRLPGLCFLKLLTKIQCTRLLAKIVIS
jgi:Clp amino terminal domain, pathogenicity island component